MIPAPAAASPSYRPHIDGLRAVAVIAVILNHFSPGLLPSGFLGVDIFFVISGFVVTSSLLDKRHSTWKEYLLSFYIRRFKRLVPALAASVLFTCVMTCFLVSRPTHVLRSGAFSLLGMSNLYFLQHATDYFATTSELNPFTHTWSLGVEEQFYLVFPMLLGLCGFCVGRRAHAGRNLIIAILGLGIPSLLGYLYLAVANPSAAFFLMPARFWEFGAGCLMYLASARAARAAGAGAAGTSQAGHAASLLALASVVGILFLSKAYHHLSVPLIVAATCAAIHLMNTATPAARLLSARPVVAIGLFSYSLYLWHWPVLSLSRYVSGITPASAPFLIALITVLSLASFHLIEKPLRRLKWSRSEPRAFAFALGGSLACFILIAKVLPKVSPEDNTLLAGMLGISGPPAETYVSADCHKRDEPTYASRLERCLTASRSDSAPRAFYLLGDSHASKMAYMIAESIKDSPYELRFVIDNDRTDFPYTDNLPSGVSTNLEKVLGDSRPGDILALTFHRGHLNRERDAHLGDREDAGPNEKLSTMRKNMDGYMRKLTEKGVRILFIRDVPLLASVTTVETCMMQERFFGSSPLCRVREEADRRTRSRQDLLFDGYAESYPGISTWDPLAFLYKGGYFGPIDERGRYLMTDWHHISRYQESLLVAPFKRHLADRSLLSGMAGTVAK